MNCISLESYSSSVSEHIVNSSIEHWRIRTTDPTFLTAVTETLQTADSENLQVEWLSTSETLKQLEKDFLIATKISELTASGRLSIRTTTSEETASPTVLLNTEKAVSFLPLDGTEAVEMTITDENISTQLWEKYESEWEMGIPESIDAPPYSRLLALAECKLGATASEDIDNAFTAIERRTPGQQPEPVTVGLLVGAKHNLLLRDVVEWAETSTLATQGTVSKLKQQLEQVGVVTTESENIGVGRPRQRLLLSNGNYESLAVDELVANVQTVLA